MYGDPEEHPQKETYFGNVNCIGTRSCYDEGDDPSSTSGAYASAIGEQPILNYSPC